MFSIFANIKFFVGLAKWIKGLCMTYKYLYFSISDKWLKLHPDIRAGFFAFICIWTFCCIEKWWSIGSVRSNANLTLEKSSVYCWFDVEQKPAGRVKSHKNSQFTFQLVVEFSMLNGKYRECPKEFRSVVHWTGNKLN